MKLQYQKCNDNLFDKVSDRKKSYSFQITVRLRERKQVLLSMVDFGKEGVAIKLYFSCRIKSFVATETWHWIKTGSCY
jgi:hypothetical protein